MTQMSTQGRFWNLLSLSFVADSHLFIAFTCRTTSLGDWVKYREGDTININFIGILGTDDSFFTTVSVDIGFDKKSILNRKRHFANFTIELINNNAIAIISHDFI